MNTDSVKRYSSCEGIYNKLQDRRFTVRYMEDGKERVRSFGYGPKGKSIEEAHRDAHVFQSHPDFHNGVAPKIVCHANSPKEHDDDDEDTEPDEPLPHPASSSSSSSLKHVTAAEMLLFLRCHETEARQWVHLLVKDVQKHMKTKYQVLLSNHVWCCVRRCRHSLFTQNFSYDQKKGTTKMIWSVKKEVQLKCNKYIDEHVCSACNDSPSSPQGNAAAASESSMQQETPEEGETDVDDNHEEPHSPIKNTTAAGLLMLLRDNEQEAREWVNQSFKQVTQHLKDKFGVVFSFRVWSRVRGCRHCIFSSEQQQRGSSYETIWILKKTIERECKKAACEKFCYACHGLKTIDGEEEELDHLPRTEALPSVEVFTAKELEQLVQQEDSKFKEEIRRQQEASLRAAKQAEEEEIERIRQKHALLVKSMQTKSQEEELEEKRKQSKFHKRLEVLRLNEDYLAKRRKLDEKYTL